MRNVTLMCAAMVLTGGASADSLSEPMVVSNLADSGAPGFADVARVFAERNEGYALAFFEDASAVEAADAHRVAFIQDGEGSAVVSNGTKTMRDDVRVGDILVLRPDAHATLEPAMDLVVFTVPQELDANIPDIVRVDFDRRITDKPGGCATDPGAYRRLLLTWNPERGPYIHHGLNCHRVRIDDSFTHYHPVEGGFDEFYLVQEAPEGAVLLTSRETMRLQNEIEDGEIFDLLARDELGGVIDRHPLRTGDLILLPRGITHRGLGGAVVQVIAVPGFRPGAEIPMDEALRRVNARFRLRPKDALPNHAPPEPEPASTDG